MPLYDYRCVACGTMIEVRHGIDEAGPAQCTACGGAMRKALSTPAIHFKGSGWAKKDAQAAASSAKKPATTDGDKKGDAGDKKGDAGDEKGDAGAKKDADGSDGGAKPGGDRETAKPAAGSSTSGAAASGASAKGGASSPRPTAE